MSFLDKIAATIMPPETEQDRTNARSIAEAMTGGGDWLAAVLQHHRQIEDLLDEALEGADAVARQSAFKQFQVILTGHSNAEETVLYPAMADSGQKGYTTMAFEEQAMTKVQVAKLEKLDPMGDEWREKLEHVRGALLHHIYQEEGTWFPELQQQTPAAEHRLLTERFLEEFERYVG